MGDHGQAAAWRHGLQLPVQPRAPRYATARQLAAGQLHAAGDDPSWHARRLRRGRQWHHPHLWHAARARPARARAAPARVAALRVSHPGRGDLSSRAIDARPAAPVADADPLRWGAWDAAARGPGRGIDERCRFTGRVVRLRTRRSEAQPASRGDAEWCARGARACGSVHQSRRSPRRSSGRGRTSWPRAAGG